MVTFFSDLDNTLIFSHRKKIDEDKNVAEYLNNAEQSYILKELAELLQDKEISLVPVTTRSIEQYQRVFILPAITKSNHALVCNGGVLLVDGEVDEEWLKESIELSKNEVSEVNRLLEQIRQDGKAKKINTLQNFMFYFTCDDVDEYCSKLKSEANLSEVFIGRDSRKIYIIASSINKGASVLRYIRRFGIEHFFTAGDSEFDVSMLNLESRAIASSALYGLIRNKEVCYSNCDYLFQDISIILKSFMIERQT